MSLIAGLIIFSVLGAWLSARSRAAGPSLVFGAVAILLFCATPLGRGLPHLFSAAVQHVSHSGGQVAGHNAP